MPTYPVINKKTGEKQTLSMSMKAYCEWKDENPDWDKDWSKGCASAGETGDWRDKMGKSHPGWADIMKKKIVPQAALGIYRSITQKYRF